MRPHKIPNNPAPTAGSLIYDSDFFFKIVQLQLYKFVEEAIKLVEAELRLTAEAYELVETGTSAFPPTAP